MREAASFIASQNRSAPASVLSEIVHHVAGLFHAWSNRRKVSKLDEFDDHILADLGLTREDVRWALNQPFSYDPSITLQWRALRSHRRGWRE
jgi:uncharacterized protein YjiS (DUF1127 family)